MFTLIAEGHTALAEWFWLVALVVALYAAVSYALVKSWPAAAIAVAVAGIAGGWFVL